MARVASSRGKGREPWIIFFVGFGVYAFLGWVGVYVLDTYNNDGVTRIAQAHGVLFSREPHLAALGFIWPPLPGLTDLPLVMLLRPLGWVLLAGPLMSAFYSAFALVQLSSILRRFELSPFWRAAWLLAFGGHNLIVHNATMGLSEAPFLAFLLMSLDGFLVWEKEGYPFGIVKAGLGAALAFFCRYDALAWAAVVALGILWHRWVVSGRFLDTVADGSVLGFGVPTVWLVTLWILVNWQIMGNPFFFLVGPGSTATTPDTAHLVGPTHPFYYAMGSLMGSLKLLWRQVWWLAPLFFPASACLALLIFWRRWWSGLCHLALAWSILGFTFFTALRGVLPPFARYFFWAVPGGVIAAGAAYRIAGGVRLRRLIALGATAILLLSAAKLPLRAWPKVELPTWKRLVGVVMLAPETGDYVAVGGQLDEFLAMAKYLDEQPPRTLTLIDATVGSPLALLRKRPRELVTTTDSDFFTILRVPEGRVEQVLVPKPTFDSRGRAEVLKLYPDIYEGGEPWAKLVHEFPGPTAWRLFRVPPPVSS